MNRSDLAVIGGGPIGLATAIRARQQGMSVTLIDRRWPPIDKACGEGVMPDGVTALEGLGIDPPNIGRPFSGIRYLDDDHEASGRFPQGTGLGIRRPVLQAALAKRAEAVGAELGWGVEALGLGEDRVVTSGGDLRADWIVAADGLHSRTRRWARIPVRYGRRRFAVRRHFAVEPWTDLVEVHWASSCEAYVTPVGEREVGVAFLWSGAKARFDSLLEKFPALRERLEGAAATSHDRGAGALYCLPERLLRDRVLLVGDAAGYLDAITGEGLSLGLLQANALVEALARARPAEYERAAQALCRLPFALIRTLLFIERRPALRRRLIRTLARDPQLFSRLLAVHARQLPPSQLGLAAAARLLTGLALPH